MPLASDFQNGIDEIVNDMGSDIQIIDAATGTSRVVQGAITSIGRDDGELVNALGIDGRKIFFKPMATPVNKLDKMILPDQSEYVVYSAHNIIVSDKVVGVKCIISGTG